VLIFPYGNAAAPGKEEPAAAGVIAAERTCCCCCCLTLFSTYIAVRSQYKGNITEKLTLQKKNINEPLAII